MRTYYDGIRYYHGRRMAQGCSVTVYLFASGIGTATPLDPRPDLLSHCPADLEYANGETDATRLILAVCADALRSDERAKQVYQEVFRRFAHEFRGEDWTVSEVMVQDAAAAIELGFGLGLPSP